MTYDQWKTTPPDDSDRECRSCSTYHEHLMHQDLDIAHQERGRFEKLNGELLDALKTILALIDDGVLVRNVERDMEPGWSLKALKLVTDLKRAVDVVAKAEGREP